MIYINEQWCKGCGLCVSTCKKDVLEMTLTKVKVVNGDKCINCGMCENVCPDFAIHVRRDKDE